MNSHNFLSSIEDEKIPVKVKQAYDGPVPAEICDYLCDRVVGCAKDGFLYPLDAMDVYHDLWMEVERVSRTLPELTSAKVTTYLHSVVDNLIRRYFQRKVAPRRAEYRAVEGNITRADHAAEEQALKDATSGRDAVEEGLTAAIEGFDYETGKTGEPQPLTTQQLSEQLVAEPWARERSEEAMNCLEDICEVLNREGQVTIITAFAAYIAADGNMVEAAHLAKIGKTKFYQLWPTWLKIARKLAEKSGVCWH